MVGSKYTGTYHSSLTIYYKGVENIIISERIITAESGINGIYLDSCKNVIIMNNRVYDVLDKFGIYLWKCENITIINNELDRCFTGVRASLSTGIKFLYNDMKNVYGTLNAGKRGQMIQLINCYGAGNIIGYNVCENMFGENGAEDVISIFESDGTEESPILVKGNWIRGGGPSKSGGGILLGDMGGSHQIAEDNILVNPGQYGIGIAGGHDMTLRNNIVYSEQTHNANVGIVGHNWYEAKKGPSYNNLIDGNQIHWINHEGNRNDWWITMENKGTNVHAELDKNILPEQILGVARKLQLDANIEKYKSDIENYRSTISAINEIIKKTL